MKPVDRNWKWLVAHLDDGYSPRLTKFRAQWLSHVEADSDGCWIWTGGLTRLGYPYMHAMGKSSAALTTMFRLWAPDFLSNLHRGMRFRLCGKTLCVRPACATTRRPVQRDRWVCDWVELRRCMEAGMSTKEASEKFHVSNSVINRYIIADQWDIPRRRLDHRAVRRAWERGLSYKELCDRFGIRLDSMGNLCRRFRDGYLGPAMEPTGTTTQRRSISMTNAKALVRTRNGQFTSPAIVAGVRTDTD